VPSGTRPRVLITFVACEAITLIVILVPGIRFAYRAPSLHVALETAAALIALLTAYLVFGRLMASERLDALVLLSGLVVLALSNLVFSAIPAATFRNARSPFSTWAPLIGRLAGAILLGIAAHLPPRQLKRPRWAASVFLPLILIEVAAISGLVAALGRRLPSGIDPALSPTRTIHLKAHPAILAANLAAAALYLIAAAGFTRSAMRRNDVLMKWLAIGSIFAAFASINYFLYPSLYIQWIYVGDAFRLLFYLVLLLGAATVISENWHEVARAFALDERRRMARDLHDGLAQELAFIIRRARRLSHDSPEPAASQIAAAAERALISSRLAIAALSRSQDESLDASLTRIVEEVAARTGAKVDLDVVSGIQVSPEAREALIRIAAEAVSNAAHHAGAESIRVELARGSRVKLRISDDGAGFDVNDVARTANGGFGLISMRERAEALGADFLLSSDPGVGTVVEVVLPRVPIPQRGAFRLRPG
jgi:signal transduction histidine kinase